MIKGAHDPRYRAIIGELREARLRLGLSQAQLADALNTRQQFVSKYESFERRLDVVELLDVASALRVDWKVLLAPPASADPPC